MTKSVAVRSLAATATWAASLTLALASEGPEGMGEMDGIMPLLYLVGGVSAMGVVIWLMLKVMNRK
ncbi:MAG: hypothetical protein IPO09_03795 [Anaeromyxobacter sp.]|nr:hypothetical protein [Anaeromyxobacter sp.]MBL0275708.1 hypothetical protein [Anaeromyxobacter sp.]